MQGGEPGSRGCGIEGTAQGTESVTWEGLPLNAKNGDSYTYSVMETDKDGNPFVPKYHINLEEGLHITNIYITPTFMDPPVGKIVTGDKPETDATFVFKMKALNGAPFFEDAIGGERLMKIIGSGTSEFGEFEITREGVFTYEISEVNTGEEAIPTTTLSIQ